MPSHSMKGHTRNRTSYGSAAAPLLEAGEHEVEKMGSSTAIDTPQRIPSAYIPGLSIRSKPVTSLLPSLPTARPIKVFAGHFLYGFVPSFMRSRTDATPEKLHPTAYLDGMRGLAAFSVFLCHLSYQFFFITFGFGQGEPGENAWLIQLPIVRLFYSGPPMVSIFFVVSGYALSYKPVRQMRARQYDGLLQTMSSSAFRRAFRLFLPCFFSTLMVFCMLRLGIYEYTRAFSDNRDLLRAKHEDHAIYYPTFYDQAWDFLARWFEFVQVWDYSVYYGSMDYDRHLWTIPCEFRASMVLFLSQLMAARLQTVLRLGFFVGCIYWGLLWDRWEICLFWSGCMLAEFDQISQARVAAVADETPAQDSGPKTAKRPWMRWFWLANFICGLYIASYPDDKGGETPGFRYLSTLIPEYFSARYRFWPCIGAVQIVWATNNASIIKGLFTGPVVQYLGKISYSLYLMHGPLIHSFGYMVLPWVWSKTGVEPRFNYELGFFLSGCIIAAALIWVSDIFWRCVDIPCVKFARWFESIVIVKAP